MDLEQAKIDFERDGVAVIPCVFTQEEVNRMRGAALVALAAKNEAYKHDYLETKGEGFPSLIFWPCLTSNYLDEVRRDGRLQAIVRYFLGDNVKQLNNQVYFRCPGDGDQFDWHQDVCFREPREDYPGIESSYLQTIVAIDDIGLDNAPVEFVPESHKVGEVKDLTKMLRQFERRGITGKKYLCKAGDVMIWSVMTVHGSEENKSKSMRLTYMNGFAKADAAKDWPFYLKDGVIMPVDATKIP